MNLAAKYRPKTLDDVVEQSLVTDMLYSMCQAEDLTNRNFLLIGPAGCGKAQPLYSKVLTPTGYIQMKDVEIGTEVFTHSGSVGKVSGIYPQGVRPIYEITLQDKTRIRVSDEHLNIVYRYNEDKKCREDYVITTTDLIRLFESSRFKLRIDTPSVEFEEQPVAIDPYLLGILIADGSLSGNFGLSNPEHDIIEKVNNKLNTLGYYLTEGNGLDHNICLIHKSSYLKGEYSTLKQHFDEYDLLTTSKNKHIPKDYLINSKEVRLSLLQGLFDGDGHINHDGSVEYTTVSAQLSEDFAFLVRSLGIHDTVSVGPSKYKNPDGEVINCNTAYTHHLKVPNGLPFYSSVKHSARYKDIQHPPLRNITSIELVGNEPCQCLMIDHTDHTYISDDFIPTHNTTSARAMADLLNNGHGDPIEIDAASHSGVDAMREIVQQARSYPVGCKYKVFIIDEVHSISSAGWQVLLKTLEENPAKSVFVLCTTNPEKIPATILSRVQTFQLSKISLDGINSRLTYILEEEHKEDPEVRYSTEAVNYIAKLANGGMRDAITLLDKALAYSKDVSADNVYKALNLPSYDDYFALLNAIAKKDNTEITSLINRIYNSGVNFVKWFEGFHAFICNIVKYIFIQDISATMIPSHYLDKISHYGPAHSTLCLRLANKLLKLNQELRSTQYLQEVAITYLCVVKKKGE